MKCRKFIGKIYTVLTTKPCLWMLRKDGLTYGRNFNVQNYVSIDISHCFLIKIGDDVTMAPGAMILAHDASTKVSLGYTKVAKVEVGNRVFIGAKAIILPGVRIGDDVIIGAGAVVSKNVASGSVVAGVPAKMIMNTKEYLEKIQKNAGDRRFNESFTINGGITEEKKMELRKRLAGSAIGLIK